MGRISNADAVAAIGSRKVFVNNSTTLVGTILFCGWGDLPDAYRTDFLQTGRDVVYWIYSSDTPIAWIVAEALAIDFQVEEIVRIGPCTARLGGECAPGRSRVGRPCGIGLTRSSGRGLG